MPTENWDVLVVGAGPAGSCAAKAAAEKGARVLLAERRVTVGVPVRCAEYIPALLLGKAGLTSDVVVQSVHEMHTHVQGERVKVTKAPGFIVSRDQFDQALAAGAQVAGAVLSCETAAAAYDPAQKRVLLKRSDGNQCWAKPKVIIGADGPLSRVGRWAGLINSHLMPAAQCRMKLTRPLHHTEIYFDQQFFGGYAWLFPRGDYANIGLGIVRRQNQNSPLNDLLRRFMERMIQTGKVFGEPVHATAGWIPAAPPDATVKNHIILAGDAAGQTHPITGAGILSAIICGALAGEKAAMAANQGDLSLLADYERDWRDALGDTLDRAHKRRQLLESQWERLDEVIKHCWVAFREYYAE